MPNGACHTATLNATLHKHLIRRRGGAPGTDRGASGSRDNGPALLAKHGVSRVDLLQIDTEGYDFEIIRMFDHAGVRPAVVRFEHLYLSGKERSSCSPSWRSVATD